MLGDTAAVKVTPAHDRNDFEIGQRHGLPALVVMDDRAIITAHGPFEGLERFEARPAIVAVRGQGRIVAEQRPYQQAVGHCSRCDTVVEPRLSLQWFVKVAPLAKAAGEAVRDGRVAIHPAELSSRYFDWVDNMHDWCISRQLWWGHRIPVWYGPAGEVVCVGPDQQALPGQVGGRTQMCSIPGSHPACGRSPLWAGPMTRRICAPSIPRMCCSPATTSFSSGLLE